MALTIQQPTSGVIQLCVALPAGAIGGALAATPLPSGVTIAAPTDGALPILGACVMGSVIDSQFHLQLPP